MRLSAGRSGFPGFVGLVAMVALSDVACSRFSGACSSVGCQDQLELTVTGPSASLPSGLHRVDVTADGKLLSCTFSFSPDTLAAGSLVSAQCSFGVTALVGPVFDCMTFDNGNAKGQRCVPMPEQFQERLQIAGTPAIVQVEQSVDGTVILQRSATATYTDNHPNGPDCEPTCRQATLALSLP